MAITRAQQVRQMLEDGGMLVKPSTDGKRPGYRSAKFQSARSKSMSAGKTSKSKSSSSSKGYTGGGGGGADAGGSQSPGGGTFKPPAQKYVPGPGDTGSDDPPSPITPPEESKKKSFFKKFVPPTQKLLYGLVGNNPKNEKAYVKYLQSQGVNIPSDLLDILNLKDDEDVDFSTYQKLVGYEPDFMLPGEEGLFQPMNFAEYMASQGNFGLITGGDLGNLKDFKNPGGIIDPKTGLPMTDFEFEKLKQRSSQYEPGGGGDPTRPDPCKGPNPPAYCFVDPPSDPTDPSTPSTGVFAGIAPRFAGSIFDFDALRAGAMDGGIMNNKVMGGMADGNIDEAGRQMYFLGKLVKKATRAVKKVAKSPIGKAALLYFGAGALGNLAGGSGLGGMFKGAMTPSKFLARSKLSNIFSGEGAKNILFGGKGASLGGNRGMGAGIIPEFSGLLGKGGEFSLGRGITLGLGIPFALDLLGVGKDDDDKMNLDEYYKTQGINVADIRLNPYNYLADRFRVADGGRINYQEGGDAEPVAKKTMPLIDMDGKDLILYQLR